MLNQLDHLTVKLDRVLALTARLAAAKQLLQAENAELQERMRLECDALRQERDALLKEQARLTAKIEDAQTRIQSILDNLPGPAEVRQLDLLSAPGETE